MSDDFVSATCTGERCRCGAPAAAKIGEEIAYDDPFPNRHNLTAYVCRACFDDLLVARPTGEFPSPPVTAAIERIRSVLNLDGGDFYVVLVHTGGGLFVASNVVNEAVHCGFDNQDTGKREHWTTCDFVHYQEETRRRRARRRSHA